MIPLFKIHIPKNMGQKLQEVFDSGFVTEGEYSDKFEEEFGKYIENKNVSLVNSGTSALTLAYHLAGIGEGDEVITTPMTCMATNEPIFHTKAKIIFADVDPKTGNISPESILKKITSKTKAIVGVHWAGQPFDIDSVNEIAKEHGLKVIEDAAHAVGSKYNNKSIGSHSDYVCFSFQAIKHITTIDGGAVTCKTNEEFERLKKLRWFGLDRKYKGRSRWEQDITECGFKMHMNNVNAAIGLEQMNYVDDIISKHISNGLFYDNEIKNNKIIKLERDKKSINSFWIYSLLVENRADFQNYLMSKNIASDVVHVRNDKYSVFKQYKTEDLKGLDFFESRLINIPVGWWLNEQERNYIVDVVNSY